MRKVLVLAAVLGGSLAALWPRMVFAFHSNINMNAIETHFDLWARCSNLKIEPERRIEYCRSMLGRGHGDDGNAFYEIGRAYLEEHKYDEALATLNSAMSYYSDPLRYAQTRAELEEALVLSGQYRTGLAYADDDVKRDPHSAYSLNQRCWLRGITGKDLGAALADCNEALKETPDDANFLDSRGLVEFKLGQMKEAAADYKSALEIDSKLATSLYMRGIIETLGGDSASSNNDIDAAKDREPLIAERFAAYGVRQPQLSTAH